jgi:hypothetical protein
MLPPPLLLSPVLLTLPLLLSPVLLTLPLLLLPVLLTLPLSVLSPQQLKLETALSMLPFRPLLMPFQQPKLEMVLSTLAGSSMPILRLL